jgi:hypothetical protein
LWILLAAWIVAGGKAASPADSGNFGEARRLPAAYTARLPHLPHSPRAIADDGPTHFPLALQTLAVLPFSSFLQTINLSTAPGTEKDLLSLTQQRRE